MLFMKNKASLIKEAHAAPKKNGAKNSQTDSWHMFSDRRRLKDRRVYDIQKNRSPRGTRPTNRSRAVERRKDRCFSRDWYLRTNYLQ